MKAVHIRRAGAVTGMACAFLAAGAGMASAHVTVNAPGATQGGYSALTFRVPTESDTASTTGLRVQLPSDQPLASVSVQPKPGWTYTVKKAKLATPISSDDGAITEAVSEINWASTSGAIKPGEFDEFRISVGPLPKADQMVFKAIQHYSDGKDVAWIEQAAAGGAEPEHPAPTLKLAAAGSGAAAAPAPSSSNASVTAAPAAKSDGASKGAVTAALVVGGIGVLLGAGGLGAAIAARRRPVIGSETVERPTANV